LSGKEEPLDGLRNPKTRFEKNATGNLWNPTNIAKLRNAVKFRKTNNDNKWRLKPSRHEQ
jgi:hypothetical protein